MNRTALARLALCPLVGAGLAFGWLQLDATPAPAAVEQPAEVWPADELVAPLPQTGAGPVGDEPGGVPTSERPATTTAPATPAPTATATAAPVARTEPVESTPTPTPRPTATATPEPVEPAPADPEPGPVWTAADQAAADAPCEARLPGSRAANTPKIGEPYDPDLRYPCEGNI